MSDNIPMELQAEIIKRVPVKALLKSRSVSKQWKSLIDSPKFAANYCVRQSRPHRFLISYFEDNNSIGKHISVADDNDTFHQHQISIPKSVNKFETCIIVGCSHGLFCFYCFDINQPSNKMVVLWNPWIRKSVDVPMHNNSYSMLAFGVSPQTKDPKIVKIDTYDRVEVFALSPGTWKSLSCGENNMHFRKSIRFWWSQVVLDGVIYFHAYEKVDDARFKYHNLIMSFDLSSEGFEEVCLPDNLARLDVLHLKISKRMESVVVIEIDETRTSFGVWVMGQGVTKSFTKLFNVMTRGSPIRMVCGFLKTGEPVVHHRCALFAYDPYSERIKDLGIVKLRTILSFEPYMGTLLLINQ